MKEVSVVVVIPIGPNSKYDYVCDTIDSIRHYVTSSYAIIVLDDSVKRTGAAIKKRFNDIEVLTTPRNYGKQIGLYLSLSLGYSFAYENYAFDVLLRLDHDGLVIGPDPEKDAIAHFQQNPEYGIIGSHRIDSNSVPRDITWSRNQLFKELRFKNVLRFPRSRAKGWYFLHRAYRRSLKYGYEAGEHCMGGACFVSHACIASLYNEKCLSREELLWSNLEEDHIFGLLVYSVGLRLGDFATGQLPMGLRWRGLPCSPEELNLRKKKVTHSTRFFEDLSEDEIRDYFRKQRLRDIA